MRSKRNQAKKSTTTCGYDQDVERDISRCVKDAKKRAHETDGLMQSGETVVAWSINENLLPATDRPLSTRPFRSRVDAAFRRIGWVRGKMSGMPAEGRTAGRRRARLKDKSDQNIQQYEAQVVQALESSSRNTTVRSAKDNNKQGLRDD